MADRKGLFSWQRTPPEFSFEVIAICAEDAIGDFEGKEIQVAAKVNTRLPREKVTITLRLGKDAEFETMTELTGRLKKDRQLVLLLEQDQSPKASKNPWHFGHALVDNVKLTIKTMNGDAAKP